jgi:integrase
LALFWLAHPANGPPAQKEICALSIAETRRLLEAAGGDRLEALYVLAVTTGMRQGELLALRWQDVDVENAVVSVRRILTRSGGRVVFVERAKDQEEPPVYPPYSAGRGSIEITSETPATGHGDSR